MLNILMKKLIFIQLVHSFPVFYGTLRSISMSIGAYHWSLS